MISQTQRRSAMPSVDLDAVRYRVAPWLDLQFRTPDGEDATGDGSYTVLGHAAVFSQWTVLYDGTYFRYEEQIAPGAFSEVLASRPDVAFNHGHDMTKIMARTGVRGIGELDLNEDDRGLRTFARIDADDPDVQALAVKSKRGLIDQMSFAFIPGDAELVIKTEGDKEIYSNTITRVSDLFDVCACAQGAYPQTDMSLRSVAAVLRRAGIDPAGDPDQRRGLVPGVQPIEPLAGGDEERARLRAAAKARVRVAASLPV